MYIVKLHIGSNHFLLSNLQTVYKGIRWGTKLQRWVSITEGGGDDGVVVILVAVVVAVVVGVIVVVNVVVDAGKIKRKLPPDGVAVAWRIVWREDSFTSGGW